jgi:hypothetical protein
VGGRGRKYIEGDRRVKNVTDRNREEGKAAGEGNDRLRKRKGKKVERERKKERGI